MATDFDTIAAISTPIGEGGIGIVRISGDEAFEIADQIYQMKEKSLKDQESHTIHYGHILDPAHGEVIDEVMVTVMRAPRTYTREDVIEINCHGGMLAVNRVLHAVLQSGARLAEPGEFTKRAFLNGRLDLSQAEAVMDVIHAKSEESMNIAQAQLSGNLSSRISALRDDILQTLAQVEVNIDYPEYDDVEEVTSDLMTETAQSTRARIAKMLQTAKQGKVLREGLATAIIGQPNVGKSSLLNALLDEEKAIVTDIAGTTRDIVEDFVTIQGVPLRLIDTAGIRETEDTVERIGVERSRQAINQADLVLLVLNQNEPLDAEDKALLDLTQNSHRIILLNKTDLDQHLDKDELAEWTVGDPVIETSTLKNQGLDQVEQAIADHVYSGQSRERDANVVSNARHIDLLQQAERSLTEVINGLDLGLPVDLVQIDLTRAWEALGEITGEHIQDELLDKLFSEFCLGK